MGVNCGRALGRGDSGHIGRRGLVCQLDEEFKSAGIVLRQQLGRNFGFPGGSPGVGRQGKMAQASSEQPQAAKQQ